MVRANPIVLLHGWGCDSDSWAPIIEQLKHLANVITVDLPSFGSSPSLENNSLDAMLDFIVTRLPENCVLIGWSLGGMLAVQLAAHYPQKISHIITLATNVKFVASRDYPTAMPSPVNRQFNQQFAEDPQAAHKLFIGLLAQGDANERALLKKLRSNFFNGVINPQWQQSLQLLTELDNRTAFSALQQPGLHLFGNADALVPASAAAELQSLNPNQHIQLLAHTAHAVHWSQPQNVIDLIGNFLNKAAFTSVAQLAFKKRVAQSFSRAASSYDAVANLQRDVGKKLLSKTLGKQGDSVVIDLGCGTGYFTASLQEKYPQATIVAVDLAEGMLAVAKNKLHDAASFVAGDAEALPFACHSVDVIFSSLALQWCHNNAALFAELNRVLKPGGQLIFSTLGPETLHELKAAWHQVDNLVHVNHFISAEQLQWHLQRDAFFVREFERELPVLRFETLSDLTRELKSLGAHNVNQGKAEGLTGRQKMLAFKNAYERYRDGNTLPATYDVFYCVAEKSSGLA